MRPEPGRSIGAAALHVCKGAPLEATRYGTSNQLRQMVRGDRAKTHPAPKGSNETESKMMADVHEWVKSSGEIAALDVQNEELMSKRRKIISERVWDL
jgi:hypothetical protein